MSNLAKFNQDLIRFGQNLLISTHTQRERERERVRSYHILTKLMIGAGKLKGNGGISD